MCFWTLPSALTVSALYQRPVCFQVVFLYRHWHLLFDCPYGEPLWSHWILLNCGEISWNKKEFQSNANCPLADRCTGYILNEMVSAGDTVSLYTQVPCIHLNLNFISRGRGYCRPSQIQSPSIWPNFHFVGGGGGERYSRQTQIQSSSIWPSFHFIGREYSGPSQTWNPNLSDNFHFWGGGRDSGHYIPQILE